MGEPAITGVRTAALASSARNPSRLLSQRPHFDISISDTRGPSTAPTRNRLHCYPEFETQKPSSMATRAAPV